MRKRILLSAYQCAPGQGSVSQIGWEWYTRLSRQCDVTLVTHIRNRPAIKQAGGHFPGTEVIYIDTEWFAGRLYRLAQRLFPRSEHAVFLLSSLDFFVFDSSALREFTDAPEIESRPLGCAPGLSGDPWHRPDLARRGPVALSRSPSRNARRGAHRNR